MKARFAKSILLLLVVGTASLAIAQTAAVAHNTWHNGATMPKAVIGPAAAVLGGKIYVMGGIGSGDNLIADTQIYDPVMDSWSTGVSLPVPTDIAAAAVVNNVLYLIGGSNNRDGSAVTNAVWAYSTKTNTWSSKTPMPTARTVAYASVENNIIYVIGGWDGIFAGNGLATVESYNPATDTWTEEAPLPVGKWAPSVGKIGTKLTGFTIVAADGAEQCCPSGFTGDNVGYNVSTNVWTPLNPDPSTRAFTCYGAVGSKLYVAGGNETQGPALGITESFQITKNAWKTLAPVPQPAIAAGSAVYKGQLYCFGGWTAWNGSVLHSVQVYQP
jgi:N-acetylneuraminic acid mutarotase